MKSMLFIRNLEIKMLLEFKKECKLLETVRNI